MAEKLNYSEMIRLHDMLISDDYASIDLAFEMLKIKGETHKEDVEKFCNIVNTSIYHTHYTFEKRTKLNLNFFNDGTDIIELLNEDFLDFYVYVKISKQMRLIKTYKKEHSYKIKIDYGQD